MLYIEERECNQYSELQQKNTDEPFILLSSKILGKTLSGLFDLSKKWFGSGWASAVDKDNSERKQKW